MKWGDGVLALYRRENFGGLLWNEAPLIASGQTADQWTVAAKIISVQHHRTQIALLSQSCPGWAPPD